MNNAGKIQSRLVKSLLYVTFAVLAFGVAVTQQRTISDFMKLHNYTAPEQVAKIASQDSFTDSARRIFYVNHPDINDRASFVKFCPSGAKEQTIVLGCYQSDQAGIFLLNVNDPRLDGVKQVTAAHEMLHAAYDRLSSSDKQSVNKQLLDYYNNSLTDERLKTTIDAYKKSEPGDVVNEMHSIFGTEVAQLPPELEVYYKQYFVNRSAVTSLSAKYQAEFTSRKDLVASADARLKIIKQRVEDIESGLKDKQSAITNRQQTLTQLRSSDVSAYNAAIPEYNQLISSYNQDVQRVRVLVNEYNALVSKRNAVAVEEDQLVKSLGAQPETIQN
ncbi:MAG: hypothetical protein QFB86_03580 [Patescibacteria group bacterium]|nr:hypothetical protein [Patescibacteria group bacterium]